MSNNLVVIIQNFQNKIIDFVLHPEFSGILLSVRSIFIIVSLIMVASAFWLLFAGNYLKKLLFEDFIETFATRPYGAKKAYKQWSKIKNRLERGTEQEYKLAVVEAENLLNDALTGAGYKGDTIVEKLEQLNSTLLPNINQVSEAHKIRNNIVHDPDYKLEPDTAKRTLDVYEKALQDLDAF